MSYGPKIKLTLLVSTRIIDFRLAHTGFEPVTSGFLTACSTAEQNALSVLILQCYSGPPWIRTRPVRFRPGSIVHYSTCQELHTANVTQNPTVFEAQNFMETMGIEPIHQPCKGQSPTLEHAPPNNGTLENRTPHSILAKDKRRLGT